LIATAILAVGFTACSQSDLLEGNGFSSTSATSNDNSIQFGTYMSKVGTTRAGYAGDLTTTTIKAATAGFGVFAYYSGNQNIITWGAWNPATPAAITKAPNFMYNQEVRWSTSSPTDQWNYSPVKYWPNGIDAANGGANPSNTATEEAAQYLSFFAYAPYVYQNTSATYDVANIFVGGETSVPTAVGTAVYTGDAENPSAPTETQNGIVAMSKNDQTKDMYVKYILNPAKDTNGKFVDLLWGLRGQGTYKETDNVNNTLGSALGTAYNTDLTKQTVDEKVKFLFKHALARVGGNTSKTSSGSGAQVCGLWAVVDVDKNSTSAGEGQSNQTTYFSNDFNKAKTLVTIEEVKIRDKYTYTVTEDGGSAISDENSDFLTEGWFDIMNGTWTETDSRVAHTEGGHGVIYSVTAKSTPGSGEYKLNPAIKENGVTNPTGADWNGTNSGDATGVNLTKEKVYAEDEDVPGLLLIPGTNGNTLYITVKYRVRTADKNLSTGFSEVTQTITNAVTIGGVAPNNLEPNKYYNLVMHLGLTSVKFEAVVADWSNGSGTYDEQGGEVSPGTGYDKSVWLPSNVVAYTATVGVAWNVGTYNYATAGFGLGDVVSGTTAGNITAVAKNSTTSTTADITLNNNETTAIVPSTTTITCEMGKVTLTINQASAPITAELSSSSISATQAVTLTVKNEGPSTPVDITAGNYTVEVFTDALCTAPADPSAYTDTTGSDNKVTFNTAGTYYIKVTSGDSTVTTAAITVS
jgi:hypothetical protein